MLLFAKTEGLYWQIYLFNSWKFDVEGQHCLMVLNVAKVWEHLRQEPGDSGRIGYVERNEKKQKLMEIWLTSK